MRAALIALALVIAAPVEADEVDVELVLAVDTSRSMDYDELKLQREGYARAFESDALAFAVGSGPRGRIAVTYVDWGGHGLTDIIVPWTILSTPQDARRLAALLRDAPVKNLSGTGISGAIAAGVALLETNDHDGLRRVIDISGDGPNNEGPPVTFARDGAAAKGIEINGLPIMLKEATGGYNLTDLDIYYQDCVVSGPAAFVMPVTSTDRLVEAILQKLVFEISGRSPPARERVTMAAGSDCLIGEKLRRRRFEP